MVFDFEDLTKIIHVMTFENQLMKGQRQGTENERKKETRTLYFEGVKQNADERQTSSGRKVTIGMLKVR